MRRLLVPLVLLGLSCGEEQSPSAPPFIPPVADMAADLPPVEGDMNEDASNNPPDMPSDNCADVVCESGDKCVRGDCVPQNSKLACQEIQDSAVLSISETHTFSGDTTGFVDTLSTTCGMAGAFNGAENAFTFQVDQDALMTLELTSSASVNWLMEVRRSECMDASDIAVCSKFESVTFPVKTGQTYTLIVEPEVGFDKGAFSVSASFVASACSPPGSRTCVEGALEECRAGTEVVTLQCPSGCAENRCLGDRCENAIEVTASASFSGDIEAMRSDFDFGDSPSCGINGTSGLPSSGQDIVLKLPGLLADQVVTVDASMDAQDDVIAVVKDCAALTLVCDRAVDLGDKLTWTVPEDGDWYVIVDKRLPSRGTYSFTVEIQ